MYQIDVSTAAPVLPAPSAAGTSGYFTDGDLVAGAPPTTVPADFLNAVMLELLSVVVAAGITPDKTVRNQVLLAIEQLIEARSGNYLADIGVANAYVVVLNPPLNSYGSANGTALKFRAGHTNTNVCTLDAGGGPVPLLRDDGTALVAGDIQGGAIVDVTYDRAANAFLANSIVLSQLGALAKLGVGQGVENDGAGNLRVKLADNSLRRTISGLQANDPVVPIAASSSILANSHGSTLLVTAANVVLSFPATLALWNGFNLTINAQSGAVTFQPNAADKVNGAAAGAAYTIVQGQTVNFVCDGAGNWWPLFQTTPPGNYSPKYINTSQAVGAGTYLVDTSAGAVTLTLATGLSSGASIEFIDAFGTWGINSLTLARNGNTIQGQASDLVWDVGGVAFRISIDGLDWRLF